MGKLNEEVVFMSQEDIELVRSAIEDQIKDKGKLEKKLDRCVKLEGILVKLPKKQDDVPPLLRACGFTVDLPRPGDVIVSNSGVYKETDAPVGEEGVGSDCYSGVEPDDSYEEG